MRSMTGCAVCSSNSVELASAQPNTSRAYSITVHCIPRQMPRNGTLCSRAYLIAAILPSTPRAPNPPGTRMPSIPFNPSRDNSSASMGTTSTLQSFSIPACCSASWIDL